MTLLKDNNYKDINVALLSLEADIKNKITGGFDTSEIDKQLAEINSRIDKINAGGGSSSSDEIEDINSKLNSNSIKIRNIEQNIGDIDTQINGIEQKLSDIFSAENKVTDFNATTNSGIYYWVNDAANRPSDYGVLLVNKYDGGSTTSLWVNQVAYGTDNRIYFRQNINSAGWTGWQQLATTDSTLKTIQLSGTVDCNTLTEPGLYTASSNAVISITNIPANISSAVQLAGGFSVLVTKTNVYSIYYGMQMFILYGSDAPFIRKSYYLNGQHWTSWEQLVTMDKLKPEVGFITGSLLSSVITGSNLYYQKFGDGRLFINGWVKLGDVSVKTKLFTLPNNWKASSNYLLPCYVDQRNIACACMVNITEGDVFAYTPIPATNELRFCGTIYLM